jgi:PEP-CTERM putative exosortase interaction domain
MLRHIGLISLAITTCAAFIPIKVNAATLNIRPSNLREVAVQPGDIIDFTFNLRLDSDSVYVTPRSLAATFDSAELFQFTELQWLVPRGRPIRYDSANNNRDIARVTFRVVNPVRNGRSDVWGTLTYDDYNQNLGREILGLQTQAFGSDVVPVSEPVPEPLTIFGTAIGLGCGVLLKRKSSKKTVF